MAKIEDLSPDQRAVLQLLLKQGKSYVELAMLLRIEPGAVRERAIAALRALGADFTGPAIPEGRYGELTDWLLGQQDAAETRATHDYLAGAPDARAWVDEVQGDLRELGGERVPVIPDAPSAPEERLPGFAPASPGGTPPRSSRAGGALLLAGLAVVVAVVLVILLTGGGDDNGNSTSSSTTPKTTTTASTTAQPSIERQINLQPPSGDGKALGVANVIVQGNQRALAIQAQDLPANTKSNAYAVWLTGGPNGAVKRLGFAPAVGKNGRLEGVAALPTNADDFSRLEISLETEANPKKPSTVVLRGDF